MGTIIVNAIGGDSDDIFGFSPSQLGTNSAGFFFAAFDGDLEGFRKTIDGIFMTPGVIVSAALNEVDVPVEVVQYEVLADDVDAEDSELNEFDRSSEGLDTEEIVSTVMLPLVIAE